MLSFLAPASFFLLSLIAYGRSLRSLRSLASDNNCSEILEQHHQCKNLCERIYIIVILSLILTVL